MSPWETKDIQNITLNGLYSDYAHFFLTVHDSVTDTDLYVNMETYRTQYALSVLTVTEWLATKDGVALNLVDTLPDADLVSARYANAILTGYKMQLAKIGYPYPDEMPLTELTDLQITRPGFPTDMTMLSTDCLVSINGYFHRTDTDGISAYVVNGGITAAKVRCAHTGILSFLGMGGVSTLNLRDEDILPLTPDRPLKEGVIIRIPGDLTGKSVLFSLGGYLVQPQEDVFYQNGDNTWVLNIQALPYYERYMESKDQLDLSSLPVEVTDTSDGIGVVQASLLSDDCIRAYLKLSQTFVTIVSTPHLYFNRINVRVSEIPGLITSYQDPVFPLIVGYGKKAEFSKVKEAGFWALRVEDNWYRQYTFRTGHLPQSTVISDQVLPYRPYLRTQGYLLEIRGDKKH